MGRACVDEEFIKRVLSDAREALEELRSIVSKPLSTVLRSRDLRYAMRFSVVLLVEALTDAAQHILVRCFNTEPTSYSDAMTKLGVTGVVPQGVADAAAKLARLRNLVIHRYWEVDDARIYRSAAEGGIDSVERMINMVERWVRDA